MLGCGSLHTLCPVGGVICEGECWGVGPCTHCAQWEGLYHGCTRGTRKWPPSIGLRCTVSVYLAKVTSQVAFLIAASLNVFRLS